MKEEDVAKEFIGFFNDGYEIYEEVPSNGGIIDFIATDGLIQIGCEVKTSFNLKVIEQAFRQKSSFHYVYVCVPLRKDYSFRESLLMRNGIGLLTMDDRNNIYEKVRPKLNRKPYLPKLKEYMKLSTAGSQNDRVTAFGWTMKQIERYLKRNGTSHIEDVLKEIDYHYNTMSSAKSSIRKWIQNGVITNIEWEKGMLTIIDE